MEEKRHGFWWVKMQGSLLSEEIVFVSDQGIVFETGSPFGISMYSDRIERWIGPVGPYRAPSANDDLDQEGIMAAHIVLQEQLIELRDSRISCISVGNGLVVREKDGSPSGIIRIPTRNAIELAVKTYFNHLKAGKPRCPSCDLPQVEGCCAAKNG
jgi:hypothetical protein